MCYIITSVSHLIVLDNRMYFLTFDGDLPQLVFMLNSPYPRIQPYKELIDSYMSSFEHTLKDT